MSYCPNYGRKSSEPEKEIEMRIKEKWIKITTRRRYYKLILSQADIDFLFRFLQKHTTDGKLYKADELMDLLRPYISWVANFSDENGDYESNY